MSSESSEGNPPRRNWVSFWSLLVLQGQNAFNDKAAQFLLVPLGAWLFATQADIPGVGLMEHPEQMLAILIVLPFILFSPIVGWFSDRFSKTTVIRAASVLQLVVLIWITAAIHYQQIWFAIVGFFMLSVQSVMLSPAKKGIVKELVGHQKLGFASGMMEIVVVLSICAGQVITGFWFSDRREAGMDGWEAAQYPLIVFSAASLVALLISCVIQRVPPQGKRPFQKSIFTEHFGQVKELFASRGLKLSAVGVAFFWGYAGYLNLSAITIPKQVLGGGSDEFAKASAILMLAASVGVFIGGAIASLICRKKIELGLVPLGGIGMVIGTLALAATPKDSEWLKLWFVVAGAGGAFLLVPLNAYLQDICPPEKRGKILAGLNLMDCMSGLIAAVVQLGLVAAGVPFSIQFIGLAVICVIVTNYAAKILPQHFLRLLMLSFFKTFYRIKSLHPDRVPKEGGVLLTPNHISYIDAFILSAACPRDIRFLMFDEYFKHPWIGPFVRVFNTVPISNTRAKEALRVAAEALEEGAVVCIFPEGQLARTGVMNEFKRGFEMIARKANCPVLPAVMDGLWGSIFSFERNKFLYKWPYRIPYGVTVAFGDPVPAGDAKAQEIRHEVESLRAESFALRDSIVNPETILNKKPRVIHGDQELYDQEVERIANASQDEQSQLVANALQIGEINAIRRKQTVMIEWDALENCRDVLAIAFAKFFDLKLVLVDTNTTADEVKQLANKHGVDQYFSGKNLAGIWRREKLSGGCYDFSGEPMIHEDVFSCFTSSNRVISMSMPHPEARTATNQHQDGYVVGTWGRLLPGFDITIGQDSVELNGASLDSDGVMILGKSLNLDAVLCPAEPTTTERAS